MCGWCEEEVRVDLAPDFEGEGEDAGEGGRGLGGGWWCGGGGGVVRVWGEVHVGVFGCVWWLVVGGLVVVLGGNV